MYAMQVNNNNNKSEKRKRKTSQANRVEKKKILKV